MLILNTPFINKDYDKYWVNWFNYSDIDFEKLMFVINDINIILEVSF